MAETFLILDQTVPAAATLTDAYTVPAATSAVVSSIVVCNWSTTATSFRITAAPAGAADATSHRLYWDVPIPGSADGSPFTATIGATLATTDVIRVYATLATLTFTVFGSQVT